MKPTVIAANQAQAQANANGGNGANGSGINIPINREYINAGHGSPQQHQQHAQQQQQQPYSHQHHQHPQQFQSHYPQHTYGSPRQNQQQPQHFQSAFGFDQDMDMDMDMFPRSRLGRMHHDPFAGFGGDPTTHFGFPQFSTMGRRGRAAGGANPIDHDDDFFHRLPSNFRQYIPEGFGTRRSTNSGGSGSPAPGGPPTHPQQQYYQQVPQQYHQQPIPQSPSKNLCDAAIQTEDPNHGQSEVDCAPAGQASVNLNQHGLRNTMDMGVKSVAEQDQQGPRSHSAPPPEQQQQNLHYQQQQQQQQPQQQQQFGTQTTPPPQFHKSYYAPQQQAHPQQQHKQQTPPPTQQQQPQTPGGSYIRTIPIFVEGRSEPIINAHKEIPNQNAPPSAQAQAHAQAQAQAQAQANASASSSAQAGGYYAPQQQSQHSQQQRPTPLNTQQQHEPQVQGEAAGLPPQTPHTLDSINKIQDIQRDVLDLMAKVEQFKGTRQEKEYVYLDEMLTRNLLKLDTIDTNGKDSIRLARKEAIKCIQASINVLEAKAEENARMASGVENATPVAGDQPEALQAAEPDALASAVAPASSTPTVGGGATEEPITPQPMDATKIQEPIPLPPPPSAAANEETSAGATAANATNTTTTTASAQLETTSTTSE